MRRKIGGLPVGKDGPRAESRTGTGRTRDIAALLRRLRRCERGVAAVEFGLTAPLLLIVLVPVVDLGIAFAMQQQLQNAAQAGAQYAATQPSLNASAVAAIVTAATSLSGVIASPAPSSMYGCPTGNGVAPAAKDSTCADGVSARLYAVVSAQVPYSPILPYPLLGGSRTLSAQSTIRIP